MNRLGNWFNSPHRVTCLICAAFFAMGAGWLASLAGSFDFIREGHIGLGIFSTITCLIGLVAGLLLASQALKLICFVCSVYNKNEANDDNAYSNPLPNPIGTHCEDSRTNPHEDYPTQRQKSYLFHNLNPTDAISKYPLSTYSIFRGLCPWGIPVIFPFWRKEYLVTLTASPSSDDMKPTSFMYSHTMAARALRYIYVVFASIWHRLIIWRRYMRCQPKVNDTLLYEQCKTISAQTLERVLAYLDSQKPSEKPEPLSYHGTVAGDRHDGDLKDCPTCNPPRADGHVHTAVEGITGSPKCEHSDDSGIFWEGKTADCPICNPPLTQCPECIWGQKRREFTAVEGAYCKYVVYERCPRCKGEGRIPC